MRTILVTLCVLCVGFVLGAVPLSTIASETAWWTQQKSNCGLPSSLAYNTWVAQGSPCGNGGSGNGRGDSTDEQARQPAADQARQEQLKGEEEKRSPAAAQTEGPIVVICHYLQNGQEDWTIDLSARTASVEGSNPADRNNPHYASSGVVTEITERQITWQLGNAPHATIYKLNRYSLNLTRNQQGGAFGDEPPIPCELRRKQI